ncbi:hypothetical protein HCN44_010771 [Aphidius gifuensis]|uniref:CHHC U11-48K-type domain-containing protein n=1 Tax=Aphidius gifuensis TaxID=684658 RepID=A0A835CT57_APHGI|nr:uncharacterized protein LOC122855885 [Aphidius gifuensis]XP_044013496.1 uncharacterized protein LOC122855885 [Aphidius gifuensis]KAF7991970.1 hypothetical protein HCN44_010771 [Aphidius gifuensis]
MPTASQYVICPLDESHRILKHRMQPHLLKCERQHDMSKKSKCPYNITHIVDTIVFPHHLETCPDAKSVHEYAYTTDEKPLAGILSLETIMKERKNIDFGDENWDTKRVGPGYDPSKTIEDKSVFRHLAVASKSERKAFREAERKRHAKLEVTNVVPPSRHHSMLKYNNKSSSSLGGSAFQINEPLRRPISESKTMSLENLSMGAIRKQMVLASQQNLPSTTSIAEEDPHHDNQLKSNNNSTINIIAKNLQSIKLNDQKANEKKFDNDFPRLGRVTQHFENDAKQFPAIGRGTSFKSLTRIPGDTSSARGVSSAWSSAKVINY